MKGIGTGFWIGAALIFGALIWFHVNDHGEGYFMPVAEVYLTLNDGNARALHTFNKSQGYPVRGGELTARTTQVAPLASTDGVARVNVTLEVGFDVDNHYDGWGFSRFDRPILYGWLQGARDVGEGMQRHTETVDELLLLTAFHLAGESPRYAHSLQGSCSTDYRHDLCRWTATLPITGDITYVKIHLRERFR